MTTDEEQIQARKLEAQIQLDELAAAFIQLQERMNHGLNSTRQSVEAIINFLQMSMGNMGGWGEALTSSIGGMVRTVTDWTVKYLITRATALTYEAALTQTWPLLAVSLGFIFAEISQTVSREQQIQQDLAIMKTRLDEAMEYISQIAAVSIPIGG